MVKRISKNKKSQKKRSQARKQNRKVSTTQSRRRSRKVSMTRSRRRSRKVSNKKKRSSKRSRKVVKKISKRQRRSRRRSRKQKQRGGAVLTDEEINRWKTGKTEQEFNSELKRLQDLLTQMSDAPPDSTTTDDNEIIRTNTVNRKDQIEDIKKTRTFNSDVGALQIGNLLELPAGHSSNPTPQRRKAIPPPPQLRRDNRKRLTQRQNKGDKTATKIATAAVRATKAASVPVDPQECFDIERDGNSVTVTRVE